MVGLVLLIAKAGIVTSGRAEEAYVLCTPCHTASLHILQGIAHESYCVALEKTEVPLHFELWCSAKAQEHSQFYYWSVVLELELLMNM